MALYRRVQPDVLLLHAPAAIADDPIYKLAGSPGRIVPTELPTKCPKAHVYTRD